MTAADSGWVVLCGAGVSVAAPSSVPSWWGFNQAILEELKRRFVVQHAVPVRAARTLERLSLDSLDVAEFSQIVSDAFAGDTWFEVLEALDGAAPNESHRVLAAWAGAGSLRAVVTTNFDTLIERAMDEAGVAHHVYDCLVDPPPQRAASAPVVVKLHGSAPRRSSLVDLGAQKRRGLPAGWLAWLETTFGDLRVVVAGFSGADLALGEDYLRLKVASARTPELRWLVRPGQAPLAPAQEVVRRNSPRAFFVEGDLPAAWAALGAPVDTEAVLGVSGRTSIMDDARPDVSTAVDAWLEHPMVDADTCGVALARLLDAAGKHSAAAALRTSIRTRARRRLRAGVDPVGATRAAMHIGQLAGDEPPARAERAIRDLDLADRALGAVSERLPPDSQEAIRLELAHDRATIMNNIARFEILSGRLPEASATMGRAAAHSAVLTGTRRMNHDAAHLEMSGAIAYLNGDIDQARRLWRRSHDLARQAGHLGRMKTTAENLRRVPVP